jgi:hypothetical protein
MEDTDIYPTRMQIVLKLIVTELVKMFLLLWDHNVHNRLQETPPLNPMMSQLCLNFALF